MRHAAAIHILAFAIIATPAPSRAQHGNTLNGPTQSSGRGAAGDLLGGGQGQGSAIPAMSSGGGAAGGGYGAGGARQSAEKILEIGKKAEENIAKGGEKFSSALEKLSSSFNGALDKLKPAEDDKNIMKSLGEDIQKRKEASDGAGAVGDEIVADIVSGTKARSDAWVETVKAQALAQQPEGPRAVQAPQYTQSVGDKIKQFSGGQGTRLGGNSVLSRADAATNPSAQIPQMPGSAQHGGGGATFGVVAGKAVSGSTSRGATLSGPVATNPAPINSGRTGNFVENNFAVAQPSGGFGGYNVVSPRAASAGALSSDVPSPTISRGAVAVEEPRSRGGVRGTEIYAPDSEGGISTGAGARQASAFEATQIPAIDGFIQSAGDREPVSETKMKSKKKSARGARQSLLSGSRKK